MYQGRLSLNFSHSQYGTTLHVREQTPPLRVIRAFALPDGAALVHLHNVSGGILGGDHLEFTAQIEPGAQVQLTTTSATRLYRNRTDTNGATQINTITVEQGGLLEMLPDPLIPYRGAVYQQHSRIDLGEGAGLFWWETVTPGREARGECFEYESLALNLQISALGRPIAIERTRIEPALASVQSPARLGGYRYFSTFYICRVGLPVANWTSLETDLAYVATQLSRPGEIVWGVSTLVAHGLVVRALSMNGRDITSGLLAFWNAAKQALYGAAAVPPRKIY
jgi:urease accessory protein